MKLELASHIARRLGLDEHDLKVRRMPGGDIASSWLVAATDYWVFVKTLPAGRAGALSAEADGLAALAETREIRVPRIYGREQADDIAWLALEYLQLENRDETADERLGRALARMHRHTGDEFGWHRNNFIGLTPQSNKKTGDWSEFFLWQRLGRQLDRLAGKEPDGGWSALQKPLFESWLQRFSRHSPPASLVHGDLWSGNAAMIEGAEPVIYDPAVHYADRECDLAMAHLFGGFSAAFFRAYEQEWPLPEGHAERRPYYQLYHLLNHANLFGGTYRSRSRELIERLSRRS
ncbi:MAG: fructosamine kinase family protein [Wenzhouxiangella sp.]|nr:fructosamine kinase family protein [Wenzhouxiangella sp.]